MHAMTTGELFDAESGIGEVAGNLLRDYGGYEGVVRE